MHIIHLNAGAYQAYGRWRVIAMLGRYGAPATWAEVLSVIWYSKVNDVWKFSNVHAFNA